MFLTAALSTGLKCEAQVQTRYIGANVTGQLSLTRTVPLSGTPTASASRSAVLGANAVAEPRIQQTGNEVSRLPSVFPHPPLTAPGQKSAAAAKSRLENVTPDILNQQGPLTVASGAPVFGFEGLSHFDQRNANNGNQFSVEPPSPSIAAANGMILEGVNNAVQVFNAQSGAAASRVVSSNELFGVAPAIDRNTGINGVFPTDMRVFYDADTNRWMVLQRSQDNDIFGDPLDESHLYLAVSQTADPTGNYNVYVMDTTNGSNPGCPCLPDFPQIGADQYGFYVSANEYNTSSQQFVDAEIFAFSKLGLASGAQSPAAYRFLLPQISGFEFAIQPATTPEAAGASYFLASGGVEYFLSSQSESSSSNQLGVWAMSNTASLQGANPSLLLTQTPINALAYVYPDIAVQRSGPLPYGSSLSPPGALAFLDGGIDSRILSLVYSGGRLFATFAAQISDNISRSVVGGEYVILSPTFRNTILSAPVLTQGLLSAPGNDHLLRPAIAVNAQGSGAIAFTLVGPDYFPSAAFVPINVAGGPTAIQIAGPGVAPEDGFTGYPGGPFPGVARWGDYSTSTVDANGNIWMATEYIPSGPRTQLANWGTYIAKYVP